MVITPKIQNKKLLLIQPTIYDDRGELVKKRKLYFIGLALPLIAALTPGDWEVEIIFETIEEIPWDTDASVIGIGTIGQGANRGKDIALEFIKRGKVIIMGGPMATLAPELVEPFCHSLVMGDAENLWPRVIDDLEKGRLQKRYHDPVKKLSTPRPRYELLKGKAIGDFLPVQSGRGCPHTCSFCSIACMYKGRYLERPIPEVIDDLKYIKELGFNKFLLLDDNVYSDREHMMAFCREVKKLKMLWMSQCSIEISDDEELLQALAESGCFLLSFGLESISPASLNQVNKTWAKPEEYLSRLNKITSFGIDVASEMIVGIDSDTLESLEQTIAFVNQSPLVAPKFYILTPIPGTPLFEDFLANGRLVTDDYYNITASTAVINHPNMSTSELNRVFWRIYNQVYSIPKIIKRCLLHRRFFKRPGAYLFYFGVNLFYRYQIKRKIAPIIV